MKFYSILTLFFVLFLFNVNAEAFYRRGSINRDLAYDYLEVIFGDFSSKVTGVLYNKTHEAIKVDGEIKFCNNFDEVLASASIYETIPPSESFRFEEYLKGELYSGMEHLLHVEWEIEDYSEKTKSPTSYPKKQEQKSIGRSNTWASDSYVKVAGVGKHSSDQFELRTGLYIVKTNHDGERNFIVQLLHDDGRIESLFTNKIGRVSESNAYKIDKSGYYLIDITADGEWTITMEYQKPRTVNQKKKADQESAANESSRAGSATPIEIELKNGRKMKASSYSMS